MNILESSRQTILKKNTYKLEQMMENYQLLIQDRNETAMKIKAKHDDILNIRYKSNELMIKLKVITLDQADEQERKYNGSLEDIPEIINLKDDEVMNLFKTVLHPKGKKAKHEPLKGAPKPLVKSPNLIGKGEKPGKPAYNKIHEGMNDSIVTEYNENEKPQVANNLAKENKIEQENDDLNNDSDKNSNKSDSEKSLDGESIKKPLYGK